MCFISCNTAYPAFFMCTGCNCSIHKAKGCIVNSLYFFALRPLRRRALASAICFWMLAIVAPLAAQQQPLRIDFGPVDNQSSGERWVCSWATAQQLAPMTFPGGSPTAKKPPLEKSAPQPQSKGRSSTPIMSDRGEQIRQTVNQWISTSGLFDAVVDFDAAIRDPSRPVWMRPEFDPGDHIHPNDAGNPAMADAFDL